MTSVGGVPGFSPNPNTKIAKPIPAIAPKARLPYLEPTQSASSTTNSWTIINPVMVLRSLN
jgi:hypothetical protein